MSDAEKNKEYDGRSVEIDTGYYRVQVWGDPDDDFETVMEKAVEVSNVAKNDALKMDSRVTDTDLESEIRQYK